MLCEGYASSKHVRLSVTIRKQKAGKAKLTQSQCDHLLCVIPAQTANPEPSQTVSEDLLPAP